MQINTRNPLLHPTSRHVSEGNIALFIPLNSTVKHSYSDFLYKPYEQMIKYDALLQIKGLFPDKHVFSVLWLVKIVRIGVM